LYRSTIHRNAEGETFELLRLEDVVRIQIGTESYKNYYGKCYKARAVGDWREEGKQKNPKDGIKSPKNHPGERVVESPFD
jgi:hypothetical protein